MASMQDRANTWSSTLGLSAGIEHLFDASVTETYGQQSEKQQEKESRYTYTSDVFVSSAFVQYPPSLDGSVALNLGAQNDPDRYVEWDSTPLQLDDTGFRYDFWPSLFGSDQ